MKLSFLIVLTVVAVFMMGVFIGDAVYKNDIEQNTTTDIYNYTNEHFIYNESIITYNNTNISIYDTRITSAVNKFMDAYMYSAYAGIKTSVELGYNMQGEGDVLHFMNSISTIFWLLAIVFLIKPLTVIGVLIYELIKKIKSYKKNK